MPRKIPTPSDCRDELRALAERRERLDREQAQLPVDLAIAVERAQLAGLSVVEISRLAGVSRETVYVGKRALASLTAEASAT